MSEQAILRQFASAAEQIRIRANEAAIDDALLSLSRVRDQLVGLDMNTAACRVDEAIEDIEDRCRAVFRRQFQLAEGVRHD